MDFEGVTLTKPNGASWTLVHVGEKLARRGTLPGAGTFDRVQEALARAALAGVADEDRVLVALASSWLVNSPADSRVLRAWSEPAALRAFARTMEILDAPDHAPWDLAVLEASLGTLWPTTTDGADALSKVLALVVPHAVPLLPRAARAFLGAPDDVPVDVDTFVTLLRWFDGAVRRWPDPETGARAAAVVDRMLWFDSDGHKHWPPKNVDSSGKE
ncbi:MAG: hypothetical protein U0169_17895 [Polyangiaceae bacterium]